MFKIQPATCAMLKPRPVRYPLQELEPSQFFFVPLDPADAKQWDKLRHRVSIFGVRRSRQYSVQVQKEGDKVTGFNVIRRE